MSHYVELSFDSIEAERILSIGFDMGNEDLTWIPRSVIDMDEFEPESDVVPVATWFAEKEGLV